VEVKDRAAWLSYSDNEFGNKTGLKAIMTLLGKIATALKKQDCKYRDKTNKYQSRQ